MREPSQRPPQKHGEPNGLRASIPPRPAPRPAPSVHPAPPLHRRSVPPPLPARAQRASILAPEELDAISVESVPSGDEDVPAQARPSEGAELTEARLLLGQAIEALGSMQRVMGEMERRLTSLEARASTQPVRPAPDSFGPAWARSGLLRVVATVMHWLRRLARGGTDARRLEASSVERADR